MTAADGAAARQACHRFLPDLVITDLELPKLHGLALIARLHEVGADVGIIAMSGSDRAFEGRKGTRRLCRAPQADRDDRFRGGSPFDAAGVGWPLAVRPKRGKLQAHTLETPGRSFGGAKSHHEVGGSDLRPPDGGPRYRGPAAECGSSNVPSANLLLGTADSAFRRGLHVCQTARDRLGLSGLVLRELAHTVTPKPHKRPSRYRSGHKSDHDVPSPLALLVI
jgi:Response regulator receiver domain